MKLQVLAGPARSGKNNQLMEEMERAHRIDPLSYIFLGPSVDFVSQFAQRFARWLGGAVPSGNFLTVEGLAIDLHRFFHPDQIYIGRSVMNLLVAEALYNLGEDDTGVFHPLRGSASMAGFLAETVRDLKRSGDDATRTFLGLEGGSFDLAKTIVQKLDCAYGQRFFDSFDALASYGKIEPSKKGAALSSRFRRRIFADGLFNLSKAEMEFLANTFTQFEEVWITLDAALWDPENWDEFVSLLGCEVTYHQCSPENEPLSRSLDAFIEGDLAAGSGLDGFVSLIEYRNPEDETNGICQEIKRMTLDAGTRPGEIVIALSNFSDRSEEFQQVLKDYGVPVRREGGESLSESRVVQLLMQPFRAALSGYPQDMLFSLLDFEIDQDELPALALASALNRIATSSGLLFGSAQSSLGARRAEWKTRLDEHFLALEKKLHLLSRDETVLELEVDALKEEMALCENLKARSEDLFQSLESVEKARLSDNFEDSVAEFRRKLLAFENLESIPEKERLALLRFGEVLTRLALVLEATGSRKIGTNEVGFERFMSHLENALSQETVELGSSRSDVVEILPISSAQFRERKVKFVPDFNDGHFPEKFCNPFYRLEDFSFGERCSLNYYQQRSWEQRVRLRNLIATSEKTVITRPVATREGEPLVLSIWQMFLGVKPQKREVRGPTELVRPMSPRELKVRYGQAAARGARIDLECASRLIDPLDRWLKDGCFSWKVNDQEVLRDLVGKNFSYTKLQDFKSCPFKFYLKRMMGLSEPKSASYDLSPLERGLAYHAVLKSLYDKVQAEGAALNEVANEALIRSEVEPMVTRFASDQMIRSRERIKNRMVKSLTAQIKGYLEFETSDPMKARQGEKVLTEVPFSLRLGDLKETFPRTSEKYGHLIFRGRIDRVDLGVKQKKGRIEVALSDYKSSSAGEWDQLRLYSLALLSLKLPDIHLLAPESMQAFFRIVRKPAISKTLVVHPKEARMVQQRSKPKCEPAFSDIDQELLASLDDIFDLSEFKRADMLDQGGNCYRCPFKLGPCLFGVEDISKCEEGST